MKEQRKQLRLITLNTHSLLEPDMAFCLDELTKAIVEEDADIVCLQEINQPMDAALLPDGVAGACGHVPCGSSMPLREGNYAVTVARRLKELGHPYSWTWTYAHVGYGRFDEGVAVFSKAPVSRAFSTRLSPRDALCARALLTVETGGRCFSSVHLGWWKDEEDPLKAQMDRIEAFTDGLPGEQFLLGDFNSPAQARGEGYDNMLAMGWQDCFTAAEDKDDGTTVGGAIDGWRKGKVDPMRIDFCFRKPEGRTISSRVIFNGTFRPAISDHCGVMTVLEI